MAFIPVPIPSALNRRVAPEAQSDASACVLRNADIVSVGKTIRRGAGFCRPDFETGGGQVTEMHVFRRRDGVQILVWATTAGTWTAQVKPECAHLEGDY